MDRYKILKGEDPFADIPHGDACTYNLMGVNYRGWRIDNTQLIVAINKNALKYLMALKNPQLKINFPSDSHIVWQLFEIYALVSQDAYLDTKKRPLIKAEFSGRVVKAQMATYQIAGENA
jgi:hypothetical protein